MIIGIKRQVLPKVCQTCAGNVLQHEQYTRIWLLFIQLQLDVMDLMITLRVRN